MPDEPRRIVIEKSSTVRRRYQRNNKQFRFTAAELKRIEREEELDRRAKSLREKEKKRLSNKKKREEQEKERKRLGLPDPNAPKVPSSQPLLSNFLGLARRPPPAPEPQPVQNDTDVDIDSEEGDTEADSDGPDDLDEELENELSCLQESVVPEEQESGEFDTRNEAGADLEGHSHTLQQTAVPIEVIGQGARDEADRYLEPCLPELQEVGVPQDVDRQDTMDETAEDTDPFDDLDEELERELFCLQDAGVLDENPVHDITHDTSNDTLASLFYDRDDDEFSDCSAFDDVEIINAADAGVASPSIQPVMKYHPPSQPAVILHPVSPAINCSKPTPIPSTGDSFRDDTADYLEEVFARGCGDSFGEIF